MTTTDPAPQPVSSRVITALMAEATAGRLAYLGPIDDPTGDRYAIVVAGRGRTYTAPVMGAWLRGWQLAGETADAPPPVEQPPLTAVRAVLVAPTLADQCRTAILAAVEAAGLDFTALAEATGRTRPAVRDALRYGNPGKLSVRMADALMAATGHRFHVGAIAAAPADEGTLVGAAVAPESAGVHRMRVAAIAHEHRLVTWRGPLEPNQARRAAEFVFERAGQRFPIPAVRVEAWLTGIADRLAPDVTDSFGSFE